MAAAWFKADTNMLPRVFTLLLPLGDRLTSKRSAVSSLGSARMINDAGAEYTVQHFPRFEYTDRFGELAAFELDLISLPRGQVVVLIADLSDTPRVSVAAGILGMPPRPSVPKVTQ